jgi:hypothetical protein
MKEKNKWSYAGTLRNEQKKSCRKTMRSLQGKIQTKHIPNKEHQAELQ